MWTSPASLSYCLLSTAKLSEAPQAACLFMTSLEH